MQRSSIALGWLAAFGIAASAGAVPVTFSGSLTVFVGSLPGVSAGGSGLGTSGGGPGSSFSLPAGVFSLQTTAPINPPLLVIDGFAVGAPGLPFGAPAPVGRGTNQALAFNGVTGTMGLSASAYLLTSGAQYVAGAIPLGIVGQGGTMMFNTLGMLIMGTIFANPYQLGMVTVMGSLQGVPSSVMRTGVDYRSANGDGLLQLVSPTVVNLGPLGTLGALSILSVSFSRVVPERTTLALVGTGLATLGALGRRNASKRTGTC